MIMNCAISCQVSMAHTILLNVIKINCYAMISALAACLEDLSIGLMQVFLLMSSRNTRYRESTLFLLQVRRIADCTVSQFDSYTLYNLETLS